MKRAKKFLAVLLSMAMVLAMSATAFAGNPGTDGKYGTKDDRGTITVKGVSTNSGIEVKAYKIVSANYDANNNFTGYQSLYPTQLPYTSGDLTVSEKQLSDIIKMGFDNSGTPITMNGSNGTYTAEVEVGSYLVVITGADSIVYNPTVVSVFYTNKDGGNDISEGIVSVNETYSWAKSSTEPKIDKKVVNEDGIAIGDGTDGNGSSQDVGKTVSYSVEIDPIPYYGGNNPRLSVNDTLSPGLSLNSTPTVKIGNKGLTVGKDYIYTPKTTKDGFIIDFVVPDEDGNGVYMLNDYQGQKVTITYTATLIGGAYNADPNTNNVILNYTRDSVTDGGEDSTSDNTYTYTFDITGSMNGLVPGGLVQKTGESTSDERNPLPGATFGLFTDEDCSTSYTNTEFKGSVSSDANGWLAIKGLKAGTYYLKETAAPSEYSVNTHIFKIEILPTYEANGKLKTVVIKIDNKETAHFTVENEQLKQEAGKTTESTEIKNTKLSSLPSTGGIGTTIFTVVGCIVMIGAAGLFFASRRKTSAK